MKTYTIKKGKHSSGLRIPRVFFQTPKLMTFEVKFHENCWYRPADQNPDWSDINKLCGFSQGWHHNNSYRIGWLPDFDNEGVIGLYHYSYSQGKRDFVRFDSIEVDKSEIFNFEIQDDSFGGIQIIADVPWNEPSINSYWFGYLLYPYFGGNLKAPNKMDIDLEFKLKF